jgi:hypothetical protein
MAFPSKTAIAPRLAAARASAPHDWHNDYAALLVDLPNALKQETDDRRRRALLGEVRRLIDAHSPSSQHLEARSSNVEQGIGRRRAFQRRSAAHGTNWSGPADRSGRKYLPPIAAPPTIRIMSPMAGKLARSATGLWDVNTPLNAGQRRPRATARELWTRTQRRYFR